MTAIYIHIYMYVYRDGSWLSRSVIHPGHRVNFSWTPHIIDEAN